MNYLAEKIYLNLEMHPTNSSSSKNQDKLHVKSKTLLKYFKSRNFQDNLIYLKLI